MLLSVITPTHQADYLEEAYQSLKLQKYKNWEWVIAPNNDDVVIPATIQRDPRVRVVKESMSDYNIGAIKRHAFDTALGDVFIELDHDDMLRPADTLGSIQRAAKDGGGFIYSDNAVFRYRAASSRYSTPWPLYNEYTFSGEHGWESYPVSVYGRTFQASKCFDITPRSLCEIYYCPDHVRCWTRETYYAAGGHNPDLSVCDDQELMIKSFLCGANFRHTGGCHYLYRMFNHNTVLARNKQIQDMTATLKKQYLSPLIAAWVRREGLKTIDLADRWREGWRPDTNLSPGCFETGVVGHIKAEDQLQWFSGEQVREFLNEAYASLVPGGYLTIVVPEVHSGMGYGDVEWKSQFSKMSMLPYTQTKAAKANGNINCRFQQIACTEVFPSVWHRDHDCKYLKFELLALKGQRSPGMKRI